MPHERWRTDGKMEKHANDSTSDESSCGGGWRAPAVVSIVRVISLITSIRPERRPHRDGVRQLILISAFYLHVRPTKRRFGATTAQQPCHIRRQRNKIDRSAVENNDSSVGVINNRLFKPLSQLFGRGNIFYSLRSDTDFERSLTTAHWVDKWWSTLSSHYAACERFINLLYTRSTV